MSLEEGLKSALTSDSTVNGLVSGRIYPEIAPENAAYPRITYERASTLPYQVLERVDEFTMVVMQVDCWDESYSGVKALANAVKGAIHGVRVLGSQAVHHCYMLSMQDLSTIDGEREDRRISMDFMVYLDE